MKNTLKIVGWSLLILTTKALACLAPEEAVRALSAKDAEGAPLACKLARTIQRRSSETSWAQQNENNERLVQYVFAGLDLSMKCPIDPKDELSCGFFAGKKTSIYLWSLLGKDFSKALFSKLGVYCDWNKCSAYYAHDDFHKSECQRSKGSYDVGSIDKWMTLVREAIQKKKQDEMLTDQFLNG